MLPSVFDVQNHKFSLESSFFGSLGGSNSTVYYAKIVVTTQSPVCGDGKKTANEECDDGNRRVGDGCTTRCRVECGWGCTTNPVSKLSTCTETI